MYLCLSALHCLGDLLIVPLWCSVPIQTILTHKYIRWLVLSGHECDRFLGWPIAQMPFCTPQVDNVCQSRTFYECPRVYDSCIHDRCVDPSRDRGLPCHQGACLSIPRHWVGAFRTTRALTGLWTFHHLRGGGGGRTTPTSNSASRRRSEKSKTTFESS